MNIKQLILTLVVPIYIHTSTYPSRNISYTLANNLVINPNITTPSIAPSCFADYSLTKNGWSTTVALIQYVIPELMPSLPFVTICSTYQGTTTSQQFLDTDSLFKNQYIYQTFNLSADHQYQFSFDWITELSDTLSSTGMRVFWNKFNILQVYDGSCVLKHNIFYVISKSGSNQIAFEGLGTADSRGIFIRNIQLKQIIYSDTSQQNTANTTSPNTTTTNTTNPPTNSSTTNQPINNTTNYNTTINNGNTSNSTQNINNTNTTNNNTNSQSINNQSNTTNYNTTTTTDNSSNTNNSPANSNENSSAIQNSSSNGYNQSQISNYNQTSADSSISAQAYAQYLQIIAIINKFINSPFSKMYYSVASLKSSFKMCFGYLIQFNHLILYNYHHRNYSFIAQLILQSIQALDDQKGYIPDNYIYPLFDISPMQLLNNCPQTNMQTYQNINLNFQNRPNGFIILISDFVFFQLPSVIIMVTLGNILFTCLRNQKLSLLFKSFSFSGFFVIMLFDGKIQQYTFYFIQELQLLIATNPFHKIQIASMIIFYFFVFAYSVSGILYFRYKYGKQIKYILDNCNNSFISVIFMTFYYGLFNILLGTVHYLFLNQPQLQLALLFVLQILLLICSIFCLKCQIFINTLIAAVMMLIGLSRIVILCTFALFNYYQDQLYDQISTVQYYWFFSCLFLLGISTILFLWQKIIIVFRHLKDKFNQFKQNKKIQPSSTSLNQTYFQSSLIKSKTPKIRVKRQLKLNFVVDFPRKQQNENTVTFTLSNKNKKTKLNIRKQQLTITYR